GILLGDRGDPCPVEGEVRGDVHVEEVDGLAVAVVARRPLPDSPAVVVADGRDRERRVPRAPVGPRRRRGRGEVGLGGLQDDLPAVAAVADDHARAPASEASRYPIASSSETTSPYFASMS